MDVRNGLVACPIHDVAFDQRYLTINGGYHIHRAQVLQESMRHDRGVDHYFGDVLCATLILPEYARKPATDYLAYHQEKILKG